MATTTNTPSDQEKDKVVFIYNGNNEVEASRGAVASSCAYFDRLLMGPFKESREQRINIQMRGYSFAAFEFLINYANTGIFENKRRLGVYIEVIQLARVWMFDKLIEQIEPLLIENISLETITTLHFLANVDELHQLKEACLTFGKLLDVGGTLERKWTRCPKPGHEKHHYWHCDDCRAASQVGDWDGAPDLTTASLTDAERHHLADLRMLINSCEFTNTKRSLMRRSYHTGAKLPPSSISNYKSR